MREDNIESSPPQLFGNAQNWLLMRKKANRFSLLNVQESSFQMITQPLKTLAPQEKNLSCEPSHSGFHPLRQRNFNANSWASTHCSQEKGSKYFRTKIYSKNARKYQKTLLTMQNSIDVDKGQIPKLKNILKNLQSPIRIDKQANNIVNSYNKHQCKQDFSQTIPYKFQSAFNTLSSRKGSSQKKKIINYSGFKQNRVKKSHLLKKCTQTIDTSNFLIIKQTGGKVNLRR